MRKSDVVFAMCFDEARSVRDSKTPRENARTMARKTKCDDEMRNHYDFSGGIRGKYAARYADRTKVVVLAPEVTAVFPDSSGGNEGLSHPPRVSTRTTRVKRRPNRT